MLKSWIAAKATIFIQDILSDFQYTYVCITAQKDTDFVVLKMRLFWSQHKGFRCFLIFSFLSD